MATRISYQRFYAPIRLNSVNISYQRFYVPLIKAEGVSISYQRFYVPLLAVSGDVRRRGFMNFSP